MVSIGKPFTISNAHHNAHHVAWAAHGWPEIYFRPEKAANVPHGMNLSATEAGILLGILPTLRALFIALAF